MVCPVSPAAVDPVPEVPKASDETAEEVPKAVEEEAPKAGEVAADPGECQPLQKSHFSWENKLIRVLLPTGSSGPR